MSVYIDPRMTGEEDAPAKPTSAKKKSAKKEETKTEDGDDKEQSEKGEEKEGTMTGNDPEKSEHQKQQPKRIKELDRARFGKMIVQYGNYSTAF